MAQLTITKNESDGTILTQAQLFESFASIEDFINNIGLDDDNIQEEGIGTTSIAPLSITEPKLALQSVSLAKLAAAVAQALVPVGTLLPYAGDTAPSGYLKCDGSAISRTTYAALFAVIGERFGQGDNATTFNLPKPQGRVMRFQDAGIGTDPDAAGRTAMQTGGATGDAVGSIQEDQSSNETHNHQWYDATPAGSVDLTWNASAAPVAVGTISISGSGTGIAYGEFGFSNGKKITPDGYTATQAVITARTNEIRMKNFYANLIIKT